MSSRERLERQLRAAGFSDITFDAHHASAADNVVIVHAAYLFEQRTISALATQQDALLECPLDNGLAGAACSGARVLEFAAALNEGDASRAAGARVVRPLELEPYDDKLRRVEAPLLEPMRERRRQFEGNDDLIIDILRDGSRRANRVTEETLELVKQAARLHFFPRRLEID